MFYVTNRYNKRIPSINNTLDYYYLTFASKKLIDASFDIKHTSNGN